MDRILSLEPHLEAHAATETTLFLLGERDRYLLRGRVYPLIADLLDGSRTGAQIVDALGGQVPPLEVLGALEVMRARGYLREGPGGGDSALWAGLGIRAPMTDEGTAQRPVGIVCLGDADGSSVVAALDGAGIPLADDADLTLVVVDDYLDRALEAFDRARRERGEVWLPVRPRGVVPWIGPLFGTADGPCWTCLAHRLRLNRPVETYLSRGNGSSPVTPPLPASPVAAQLAASMTAMVVARMTADPAWRAPREQLLSLRLDTLNVEGHPVVRRPQCPVCGDPGWPNAPWSCDLAPGSSPTTAGPAA